MKDQSPKVPGKTVAEALQQLATSPQQPGSEQVEAFGVRAEDLETEQALQKGSVDLELADLP